MEERSDRLAQIRAITYKRRDSWWTVLLVDPLAIHLVRLADRLRWVTPNRITTLAFLSGLGAASAFLAAAFRPGETLWLIVGAVAYHLAFTFDCVDGKLARWQRRSSPVGGWLDFSLDQIRVVMCALALLGGQYKATGQASFTLVATAVVALHMFRYLNGSLMERALFELRGPPATHRPPTVDDTDDLPLTLPEPTSGTAEAAHPGPTEPELGRPSAVDPQPAGGAAGGGTGVGVGGASGRGRAGVGRRAVGMVAATAPDQAQCVRRCRVSDGRVDRRTGGRSHRRKFRGQHQPDHVERDGGGLRAHAGGGVGSGHPVPARGRPPAAASDCGLPSGRSPPGRSPSGRRSSGRRHRR